MVGMTVLLVIMTVGGDGDGDINNARMACVLTTKLSSLGQPLSGKTCWA